MEPQGIVQGADALNRQVDPQAVAQHRGQGQGMANDVNAAGRGHHARRHAEEFGPGPADDDQHDACRRQDPTQHCGHGGGPGIREEHQQHAQQGQQHRPHAFS